MAINREAIVRLASEIINSDWFGPTGQCWCQEKRQFVSPDTCDDCPECSSLRSQDIRQVRYLRLHDDYRSM